MATRKTHTKLKAREPDPWDAPPEPIRPGDLVSVPDTSPPDRDDERHESIDPEAILHETPAQIGTIRHVPDYDGWYQKVFDPDEAASKFEERNGTRPSLTLASVVSGAPAGSRLLAQMVQDIMRGWRRLPVGNAGMLEALEQLRLAMPNFATPLALIITTIRASAKTGRPFRLPPIILNGEPGTGKTRFAQNLGKALGVSTAEIAMPSANGTNVLTGTDLTWKASRPGHVTTALVEGHQASPLIFMDELEKTYTHANEEPLDVLHALWEPQSALKIRDECLEIEFAADHVIWIATSNETRTIRPSLLDRARIFDIPRPASQQMRAIIEGIYKDLAAEWHEWFPSELDPEILSPASLAELGAQPPRRIKTILAEALIRAAADGRHAIHHDDIIAVASTENRPTRQKIGFV